MVQQTQSGSKDAQFFVGILVTLIAFTGGMWYLNSPKQGSFISNHEPKQAGEKRQISGMSGSAIKVQKTKANIVNPNAEVVWIPAGKFMMGSPKSEPGRLNEEIQREITITKGFWMMKTEVTQKQFEEMMGYNPSHFKKCGENCPVDSITWHEAAQFANRLSEKHGLQECFRCTGESREVQCKKFRSEKYTTCQGWRMPTEAEFEYAARAKTTTPFYTGKCLGSENANYNASRPQPGCPKGEDRKKTMPVGSFKPNPWGLHDIIGNAWEWTYDWYNIYFKDDTVDPTGSRAGRKRTIRGGGWRDHARGNRAAVRSYTEPDSKSNIIGFRLVRLK